MRSDPPLSVGPEPSRARRYSNRTRRSSLHGPTNIKRYPHQRRALGARRQTVHPEHLALFGNKIMKAYADPSIVICCCNLIIRVDITNRPKNDQTDFYPLLPPTVREQDKQRTSLKILHTDSKRKPTTPSGSNRAGPDRIACRTALHRTAPKPGISSINMTCFITVPSVFVTLSLSTPFLPRH